MYTTSRYASRKTCEQAKKLARENGERYCARGKRTIDDLAKLALSLGDRFINILREKEGEGPALERIEVDAFGKWGWV